MAKKPIKKIAAKDADQYMLRLPPGLRDRVAQRAAENGRSMNTEIIDAIDNHLKNADRISQLWELFEKHRENLEAIPRIWDAVEYLEGNMDKLMGGEMKPLTSYRYELEESARRAAEVRKNVDELGKRTRALEESAPQNRKARQHD